VALLATALLIGGITLAGLTFLGYGLTRLVLPPAFSREGLLWTPFVGYTFASIVCHALNVDLLSGTRTMQLLFGLGAIANGLGFAFGRPISSPPRRSLFVLLGVTLAAFVIGVAPLGAIGQLTAIGKNYDLIDIYDATAAYLLDYPVHSVLANSPPNPLARLVVGPVTLSNGWGLSYLHAMASLLTDRSAIETQTPVFSLMHALVVPAAFVFLRRSAGFGNGLALAASAALGLHGLLLSIAFIGLGNHTAILALLPLIFASTFLAIDELSPRSVAFAGLMLTNIPLTYWAAFPFYLPPVLVYACIGPRLALRSVVPASARRLWQAAAIRLSRHGTGVHSPFHPKTELRRKFTRAELVPLARFLAGVHKAGRLCLYVDDAVIQITFCDGGIHSVTTADERGLLALGLLLSGLDAGEFAFEAVADPGERDIHLEGPMVWRFLEFATEAQPAAQATAVSPRVVSPPVQPALAGLRHDHERPDPHLRGTYKRAELVPLARFLAGVRPSGCMRLSVGGWPTQITFRDGDIHSVRVAAERGLAAVGLLLSGLDAGEFTFDALATAGEPDFELESAALWRLLEYGTQVRAGVQPIEPIEAYRNGVDHSTAGNAPRSATDGFAATSHARRRRYLLLLTGIIGSVVLALPGYERIVATILQLSAPSQGWGQTSYVDLRLLAGLSYWAYPAPTDVRLMFGPVFGGGLIAIELATFATGVLLGTYALLRLPRGPRAAFASLLISDGAALVYFRFINPYPYAYFKTMTFGALVEVPLIVLGLRCVWNAARPTDSFLRARGRLLAVAGSGLFTSLLVFNTVLTTASYFDQTPGVFTGSVLPPSLLELRQIAEVIPRGATVWVSSTPPLRPEVASVIAFFLRDHPLYGEIDTLESYLKNTPPGGAVPEYGVLAAREDPTDAGYKPQDLIWSNADVKVYRRGDVIAVIRGLGGEINYAQDRPLSMLLTPESIAPDEQRSSAGSEVASRQLILELATLEPRTIHLTIDGKAYTVPLAAGLSRYATESIRVPAHIDLTPEGQTPLFVRSLTLRDATDASSALVEERDVLVVTPSVDVEGSQVKVRLDYAGAELWTEHMSIGLNVGGNSTPGDAWTEFGWWGTDLQGSRVDLDFDVAAKHVSANTPADDLRVNSVPGETRDGTYQATLNFWEPTQASLNWHSPFFGLFRFQVQSGQVVNVEAVANRIIFLSLRDNYQASHEAAAALMPEVAEIQSKLPPAARILLGSGLRQQPLAVAALVQGLPGAEFYADFLSGAHYPEEGRVYDFAILPPDADPGSLGYRRQDQVLARGNFALYRRGANLAHLQLEQAGAYPRLLVGDSLTVYATEDNVSLLPPQGQAPPATGQPRQVTLTLASLNRSAARITVGDGASRVVDLPGGVVSFNTEPMAAPGNVSITGSGDEPIYVLSADLTSEGSVAPGLAVEDDALLVRTRTERTEDAHLALDVRWAGGAPSSQFRLGVNLNGVRVANGDWFAGAWWGVPMTDHEIQLELDLDSLMLTAHGSAGSIDVARQVYDQGDDAHYTAELSLWEPELARRGWSTPFIRFFEMQSRAGRVTRLVPAGTELTVVSLRVPDDETSSAASARLGTVGHDG
jgi:hypothetical protein